MASRRGQLVLAPAAKGAAAENFRRSVHDGVQLADLPVDVRSLASSYAVDGRVRMWGSRANKDSVWEQVRVGDRLLFYTGGRFAATARVVGRKRDRQLADAVWPPEPDSWHNVLFLRDVRTIDLPVSTIGALLGYRPGWQTAREFMIPAPAAQQHALEWNTDVADVTASLVADSLLREGAVEDQGYVERISAMDEAAILERIRAGKNSAIPGVSEETKKRIRRDRRLVEDLKHLYDGHCQVCDDTFRTTTGHNYCEVGHNVPLRERSPGIDTYLNLVVLCATCHKKLDHGPMRIFWDKASKRAMYEWQGTCKPLRHNKHIHTGWKPAVRP